MKSMSPLPRLFLLFLVVFSHLSAKQLDVDISAGSAILINAKTGAILYEKNPNKRAFPASTTKIGTALYLLNLTQDFDQVLVASAKAVASISPKAKRESNYRSPSHLLETDGTHISIKRGEEFPLKDLFTALFLASANDAANVIAEHFGGTIEKFVEGLNTFLANIGCQGTQFTNPHGLHHPNHYSTAYDLALMTREGLKYPRFAETVALKRATLPKTNLQYERNINQGNRLVRGGTYHYPKAIGVKTGYTSKASGTLVAAAREGERTLIGVVLGYKGKSNRYPDMRKLFDAAFSETQYRKTFYKEGAAPFVKKIKGGRRKLKTTLPKGLYYDFYPSEETDVRVTLQWELPELPIEKGALVATLYVVDSMGNELNQAPLVAAHAVKPNLWYALSHLEGSKTKKILLFGGGAFLLVLLLGRKKKAKQRRQNRRLF